MLVANATETLSKTDTLENGTKKKRSCNHCASKESISWYRLPDGQGFFCRNCYTKSLVMGKMLPSRVCQCCFSTNSSQWHRDKNKASSDALYVCRKCYIKRKTTPKHTNCPKLSKKNCEELVGSSKISIKSLLNQEAKPIFYQESISLQSPYQEEKIKLCQSKIFDQASGEQFGDSRSRSLDIGTNIRIFTGRIGNHREIYTRTEFNPKDEPIQNCPYIHEKYPADSSEIETCSRKAASVSLDLNSSFIDSHLECTRTQFNSFHTK